MAEVADAPAAADAGAADAAEAPASSASGAKLDVPGQPTRQSSVNSLTAEDLAAAGVKNHFQTLTRAQLQQNETHLVDVALQRAVEAFESQPFDLKSGKLERKFAQRIVDSLPITLDLKVAAEYLTDLPLAVDYWKRRAVAQAKAHSEAEHKRTSANTTAATSTPIVHHPNPRFHGNSWQQTFFEELVEAELSTMTPSMDLEDITEIIQLAAPFVKQVRLPFQRTHFDIREALAVLPDLEVIELTFAPKSLGMKAAGNADEFGMRGDDLAWMAEGASKLEKLRELKLASNGISDIAALALPTFASPQLAKLDLQHNNLSGTLAGSEEFTTWLASADCPLREVYLRNNRLTPADGVALGKAIASEGCKLTHVDVGMNDIGTEGVHALLVAAAKSKTLQKLHVGASMGESWADAPDTDEGETGGADGEGEEPGEAGPDGSPRSDISGPPAPRDPINDVVDALAALFENNGPMRELDISGSPRLKAAMLLPLVDRLPKSTILRFDARRCEAIAPDAAAAASAKLRRDQRVVWDVEKQREEKE